MSQSVPASETAKPAPSNAQVSIWYLIGTVCFLYLAVAGKYGGAPGTIQESVVWHLKHPFELLFATIFSAFAYLILSLILFSVLSIAKSNRSWIMFTRILKGLSIAILVFVILGALAGLINNA